MFPPVRKRQLMVLPPCRVTCYAHNYGSAVWWVWGPHMTGRWRPYKSPFLGAVRMQVEAIKQNRPLVVVGTPGRLAELSRAGTLQTHPASMLVLDEVGTAPDLHCPIRTKLCLGALLGLAHWPAGQARLPGIDSPPQMLLWGLQGLLALDSCSCWCWVLVACQAELYQLLPPPCYIA